MMDKYIVAVYASGDTNEYIGFTHSHNLCIMKNGEVVKYLELERFSRKKYDNRLDLLFEDLIEKRIVELPETFDFVLVNDFISSNFTSANGVYKFRCEKPKELSPELIPGILTIFKNGNEKTQSAWCCPHELAHAFSALPFYGDLKDNSLLVSFDGASSLGNYSAFVFKNKRLSLIENNWTDLKNESKYFNDNPLIFKILGIHKSEHTSAPGKIMGYAGFGEPRENIEKWLLENNCFFGFWNRESELLDSINRTFGLNFSDFDQKHSFFKNIAATFQHMFEKAVLGKLKSLQKHFNCNYLYYGGGCALNIVTNTKILESGMFKDVFVAPCCNDSGLSIGAASFLNFLQENSVKVVSPYRCNIALSNEPVKIFDNQIKEVAELLMKNKIIAVCNGNAECGPRALCNRSLIALANNAELAKKISMDIKKREWYRPIAPVMLLENAMKMSLEKPRALSKFMLTDFHIKEEFRHKLSGCIHINNTARIQVVEKESDNPFMYSLLKFLQQNYGVSALINTSFNVAGEPMVHTIENAKTSARKMNVDALIINGKIFKNGEF